jgi:hypothetical protein
MKILFLIGATSRVRNFHESLKMLGDRGHDVRLTGRLRKGAFELPPWAHHPRITGRVNPTQRVDEWRDVVELLRGARDYVRYFDPRFAQATRLVRRAYEIAPTEFVLFCERHPWMKRHWERVASFLALVEDLIPSDPGFEAFMHEEAPDVALVTPLVTFESYQTDYVKAAHRLGVPIVFMPFSWDNLTNKGLIRIQPDRVLVWNDVQRREAIELHGCAPDDVVITGAARFDDFFDRQPSMSRAEFFREHGLDPSRPMVLYLGSSQLTGPNEMELVRRWAESLRASNDEALRTAGILIRPHPAVRNSYITVDYSDLGNVAVQLNASRNADQELFDSLHHAHAAVGLNTSAMLEAAIVGRPVHTLVLPGFDEGQVGTMHFYYLVEAYGGLATIARDFPEHHRQLAGVLQNEPVVSEKSRTFAQQFLRPHGIDRPVSPIVAAEIERAAGIVKRPRRRAPLWHGMARRALLAFLGGRRVTQTAVEDSTVIATSQSLRPVKTALEEIQQGTAPVFVGPWVDSVANELLYWIPFVRWMSQTYGIPRERLIVVSHNGVAEWYGTLAQRYIDSAGLFSRAELEHWSHRSVPQRDQDPKQAVMSPFDTEIIERAAKAFELSDYQVFHPFTLFRVFRRLLADRGPEQLAEVLRHQPLDPAVRKAIGGRESYVAVSLQFSQGLPDTEENRRFLSELLAEVAAEHDVVVVDCPPPAGIEVPDSPRIKVLDRCATDAERHALQMRTLARARVFVGGHNDLAVLAAFCSTPALTYHSKRMEPDRGDRLVDVAATGGWAPVSIERTRRFKGVRLPVKVAV